MIRIGYLYADPLVHADGCTSVPRIDFHRESKQIRMQLEDVHVSVEWLQAIATVKNLEAMLKEGLDFLHYSGHGTPGGISFEASVGEEDSKSNSAGQHGNTPPPSLGQEVLIDSIQLETLLKTVEPARRPKCVLVSACHSQSVAHVFAEAGST